MAIRNGNGGKSKRSTSHPAPAQDAQFELRVENRSDETPGPSIRVVLSSGGRDEVDLTRSFTSAIAHCLWMARAGDDAQNWIDAEHLLERLLAHRAQRPERRILGRDEPPGPLPEPGGLMLRRDVIGAR